MRWRIPILVALVTAGRRRRDGLAAFARISLALVHRAEVPQDTARDNADVAAIARIAGNAEDLETLDAYCATGSLRRAAELLHLHHSSIARRLEQIAKTLDIELTEPTGLIRARLALTAWRLHNDCGRSSSCDHCRAVSPPSPVDQRCCESGPADVARRRPHPSS